MARKLARGLMRVRYVLVLLLGVAILGLIFNGLYAQRLAVADAASGVSAPAALATSTDVFITEPSAFNWVFSPPQITVTTGTVVYWTNNTGVAHTVTSDPGGVDPWDSGTLGSSAVFSRTFNTPGVLAYHCSFHPGMLGSVVVLAPKVYLPLVIKAAML
ncbi:MAG: plastocyanin/azurin family copper-binding protein [Chloroflexi bacterium]|nr:plastocyanin/azurin family copper-binding protein [Chloroflexota bacterium]